MWKVPRWFASSSPLVHVMQIKRKSNHMGIIADLRTKIHHLTRQRITVFVCLSDIKAQIRTWDIYKCVCVLNRTSGAHTYQLALKCMVLTLQMWHVITQLVNCFHTAVRWGPRRFNAVIDQTSAGEWTVRGNTVSLLSVLQTWFYLVSPADSRACPSCIATVDKLWLLCYCEPLPQLNMFVELQNSCWPHTKRIFKVLKVSHHLKHLVQGRKVIISVKIKHV